MKISVFSICYNEEFLLPIFIDHYKKITDSITIWDNCSKDKSLEIMKNHNIKTINFDSNEQIRDDLMRNIKNQCWKKSRDDDWIIVVDIDELVYHPNLRELLSRTGATILTPNGYCMISNEFPTVGNLVNKGYRYKKYDKPCIFKPNKIQEMNYLHGAHEANPIGEIICQSYEELKLLHYMPLTLDFFLNRYQGRSSRLSHINKMNNWGIEYKYNTKQLMDVYSKMESMAEIIL